MDSFKYKDNILYAENVRIPRLAKTVGTPFYCYSSKKLTENYNAIKNAVKGIDALICYSMKANSNQAVIKTLAKLGAGADIVSIGELKRAEAAKIKHDKIVFSGVGKTQNEIDYAIAKEILCINIESKSELDMVSQRAKALNKIAPVSIRINPGVSAITHKKISTGILENKFGVSHKDAIDVFMDANRMPNIQIKGIDIHIGSQITNLRPYERAFDMLTFIIKRLRRYECNIEYVDVGGGLGINYYGDYRNYNHYKDYERHINFGRYRHSNAHQRRIDRMSLDIEEYAMILKSYAKRWNAKVILEPGRYIVGDAGILVTEVLYVKRTRAIKRFVIVDAAMNDLLRPTLYNAYHEIIPVEKEMRRRLIKADIVGPICETGDYLAEKRMMRNVNEGELLAIKDAGAYGAVQSSTYNSRLLIPEVMVKGSRSHIVRPRQSYQKLINLDSMPEWLE